MNEDALNDLKEFITATVSQQLSLHLGDVHNEISGLRKDMKKMESRLSNQIQDLSNSVSEAMTAQNDETDKQLQDHEHRITTLETKPA